MTKSYTRSQFLLRICRGWNRRVSFSFKNPVLIMVVIRWDINREACFETLLDRWER